jgi:hypothetical protein
VITRIMVHRRKRMISHLRHVRHHHVRRVRSRRLVRGRLGRGRSRDMAEDDRDRTCWKPRPGSMTCRIESVDSTARVSC